MYFRFKTCCLFLVLFFETSQAFSQASKLVDDHFSALSRHDVKAIAAGYADSTKVYSPNWEGAKTGTAGITEVYTRYFASTPDLTYKVINTIYAGDNIVVEYTVSGTLSNPEGATPAYMKGKKYTLNYCAVFDTKNWEIVKKTDYFDQVAFLRQVGFLTKSNKVLSKHFTPLLIFSRPPISRLYLFDLKGSFCTCQV